MAKQRMVSTVFWDDKYIKRLPPNGKLLFIYSITGPLTTISGAYEITLDHFVFHTGLQESEIILLLEKFEADEKATFKDGWLFVHNMIGHQTLANEKIRKGVEDSLSGCPDWIKDRVSIRYQELSHLNLNSNLNLDSNSNLKDGAEAPKPEQKKKSDPKIPLPDDFRISAEIRDWAAKEAPSVDIDRQLAEFKTFWIDIATRNNRRTLRGWVATWQNRMREVQEKSPGAVRARTAANQPGELSAELLEDVNREAALELAGQ